MPASTRRWHVVLAIAAFFAVGVAAFFVMRGSNAEHPVAGSPPTAAPVVAATPEPAPRSPRRAPASAPPPAASTAAFSSLPRDTDLNTSNATAKTAASQWKSWRDAPPIDRDRALDMLADRVAMEREGKADENSVLWSRKFERNPIDATLTDEVNANVQRSFSSLDADAQQHVVLGSVECRGDICQVLAAMNGYVYDEINNKSQSPIDMQQMYDVMAGQPWGSQSGWVISNTRVYVSEGNVLFGMYFTRPTK